MNKLKKKQLAVKPKEIHVLCKYYKIYNELLFFNVMKIFLKWIHNLRSTLCGKSAEKWLKKETNYWIMIYAYI